MAEDQGEQELTEDEKNNLKTSLEETEKTADSQESGLKSKLQKILSNKKLLMIVGGILLALICLGVFFSTKSSKPEETTPAQKKEVEKEAEKEIEEDKEEIKFEKVNIYKLEPFFVPILENGKETGKFISLSANLLLSNSALHKEIERVLPLVRKKIYNILRKKRPSDFTVHRSTIEQRIKKEITRTCNTLLLTGTGTVTDVLFTSFIIK
tara:strand:+ start:305 stop:934 length:630 start_codon:yes stop_codon:yes gene_type:complete